MASKLYFVGKTPVEIAEARKAIQRDYMRDYMRKYRARQRAHTTEEHNTAVNAETGWSE
jgi:hypothetical protein